MRTGVKTLLTTLSLLALIAGCESPPSKIGPKTGYLYFNDDSLMSIELGHAGRKLEGTMQRWEAKPDGRVEVTIYLFDGVLDGEKVSVTLNSSVSARDGSQSLDKTITGTLKDNTLTLPHVGGADGGEPVIFRRASEEEIGDATLNLQRRAVKKITKQHVADEPDKSGEPKKGGSK